MTPEQRAKRNAYMRVYNKEYRRKNLLKVRQTDAAWRDRNRLRLRQYLADWMRKARKRNPAKYKFKYDPVRGRKNRASYQKTSKYRLWLHAHRRKQRLDPNYRLKYRIGNRIRRMVLKNSGRKCGTTESYLGCTIANFRIYIESRFEPGMTWDNIHLDHIIPCSLFDLTRPDHQKRCFHFSNYQPLFAKDNILKSNRLSLPVSGSQALGVVVEGLQSEREQVTLEKEL